MVIANFLTPCGGGARWGVEFISPHPILTPQVGKEKLVPSQEIDLIAF